MGDNSCLSEVSSPKTPMASPQREVLSKFCCFGTTCTSQQTLRIRRQFRGDEEESQYADSNGLSISSYYSVFVVRLAIMGLLAILIGLLTILTWHFTRVYTTKSLDNLAYGLRYELLQRPLLRMWNILNSTIEITTAQVRISEHVIQQYTSEPVTQARQVEFYEMMRAVTWALFASHKDLSSLTVNYKNGYVQAFHRDHRNDNTFYIYSDLVNYSISGSYEMNKLSSHQHWNDQSIKGNLSAIWYRETLDPDTGLKIGKQVQIPPDDLINIAGPSQVPDGVPSWHVAVSKSTSSPLLSAALPVWDPSNETIVAVVGVRTALYSVGQLMKELVEIHSGHIYLSSQEGYLLATSTNAPLLNHTPTGSKLVLAVDSEDDVIQQGAQWLQKAYPNMVLPSHGVHVEDAELGNKKYYIDSFFLNLKRLPMIGVILIPREYIMGKADRRAIKTLVILISASVCILFIGCICIFLLTNGVSKEMKLRAELISQLDARRRAEASSNYKSEFLANMSHDLRTPMAAVIGLLDILMCDDYLTNEQYATVTQIRKCSNALLRLLNNILDLSKVQAGKLVLESTDFDLGKELEGLIDMFSVQCLNHHVETLLDISDDMPKLIQGDSARVAQIFANLIANSIKFTTSGHVILRGWCEKPIPCGSRGRLSLDQTDSLSTPMTNSALQGPSRKNACSKDNKIRLWFEVDDTGSGIDPSKWESVFESFEQADLSTTRMHGGTGLGLCIVRTLVRKMGGDIKIVKKNGPGTLMQLCLQLGTSTDRTGQRTPVEFANYGLVVLLALSGCVGRLAMSQWLDKKGVPAWQASDWNELTQMLQEIFQGKFSYKDSPISQFGASKDIKTSQFVVVVDVDLLDMSTNWKEQLNYLCRYAGKAKFAWILNHDTSSSFKMELQKKGHLLMFNRPLYKSKMIHILEAVIEDMNHELQDESESTSSSTTLGGDMHECLEADPIHYDGSSSEDLDKQNLGILSSKRALQIESKKVERIRKPPVSKLTAFNNYLLESDEDSQDISHFDTRKESKTTRSSMQILTRKCSEERKQNFAKGERKSLEGLRILLAEDTPVLQKVATIMLEKLGARVKVVGDGLQAINALEFSPNNEGCCAGSPCESQKASQTHSLTCNFPPFDLILMDCQMPNMNGYEATKAIRKLESGIGTHIPIVALTAHAMSSDQAKCLEVGMDAYLTKPIDYKLMESTISSLTRKVS